MSPEDCFCEDLYRYTTYRTKKGRNVLDLPFKSEFSTHLSFGPSRTGALTEFFRNQNNQVIKENLSLGHMSKIEDSSIYSPKPSYYLPHHAVSKPDSIITKLCVVFNGSCPFSNGISLNNAQY